MRVSFVLSFLELTGGHIAVLEIANRLAARGHEVTFLYPRRSVNSRRNDLLRRLPRGVPDAVYRRNGNTLTWGELAGQIVEVADLDGRDAPAADWFVATAWQTAERVADWPDHLGRKAYFIQHNETWTGGAPARVEATWAAPFRRIASSDWLAELLRERVGVTDVAVVPYGVDLEVFRPLPRSLGPGAPRVGLLYHEEPWKGVADALEALRRVGTSTQIVAFGLYDTPRGLPEGTEYHRRPARASLPQLYSSLDVFLCASWSETGPMTVPEAMACGTCVVSTDVGNVRLWTADGDGAFVVPPRDAKALAAALERALADPEERERRARRGRDLIAGFTWERAAERFEEILST